MSSSFEPQDALSHPDHVHFDIRCEVLPSLHGVPVDGPIVGDDEGHHHHFRILPLPSILNGPFAVLLILLFEGLIHFVCCRHLHIDDDLPPLSCVTAQPHQVGVQLRSSHSAFAPPLVGPQVLCPNGDLVSCCFQHLPFVPLLFVGDKLSRMSMRRILETTTYRVLIPPNTFLQQLKY